MEVDAGSLEDFNLWTKQPLEAYLKARGLPISGTVQELRALAYAAHVMKTPLAMTMKSKGMSFIIYASFEVSIIQGQCQL